MFTYRECDLPDDPVFPTDLTKLGYFINDNDQIRMISDPELGFQYKINRNDRFNVKQREAFNECIRKIVFERITAAGLGVLRLPLGAMQNDAHVPILVSDNLHKASRFVVYFGEPNQDLGIWSNRAIGSDGIQVGCMVEFAQAVLGEDRHPTGTALILANSGQLVWYCAGGKAMTQESWLALNLSSAVDSLPSQTNRNKILGNLNAFQHVQYIFEWILSPRLRQGTTVDVIAMSEGGLSAMHYLKKHWSLWRNHISGMCVGSPIQTVLFDLDKTELSNPDSFTAFVSRRCRGYLVGPNVLGTPEAGYVEHGCNCYASGEDSFTECIMPKAWRHMLSWLDKLQVDPSYQEQPRLLLGDMDAGIQQPLERMVSMSNAETDIDEEVLRNTDPSELGGDIVVTEAMSGSRDIQKKRDYNDKVLEWAQGLAEEDKEN
ncbi:Arb2 domain-containing protein [Penicillium alfredii]|uniref:Arb2 domain-containing protein n=1 Tax=Penicillium alfredii TaxID=1506179 RepID=A0A9W9F8N4_9EURO|nr:Arb2 domain-containing protein [Penicillium alfredii]KAJ5095618.1 Arb2 domain-containing protein [Penicillium alfredii]